MRRHPLRILLAFEPPEGGVQAHVRRLAGGLVERGHDVDVITSRDQHMADVLTELGARVHALDLVPELANWGANLSAGREMARVMRERRPDVVHLHDAKAGVLGRVAAARVRAPAVYSPHSWVYRNQHLRHRRAAILRRGLTLNIERALVPLTEVILCISEDEAKAARGDLILGSARLRVVHYGIAPERAEPDRSLLELRAEGPLFGFMARLTDQKGLPVLMDALTALGRRGALPRVAIVGSGPEESLVRERIARERLHERVAHMPFEPPVWPKLAAFDALILPSLWEGLPIGLLEAMASSLPVVASAVHGIPEAVEDGVTGVLVAPGDPVALAAAIERLAGDPGLRERMGAAAHARFEEKFALDRMVNETEGVYREVLSGRADTRSRR
ncbi:MAG: glycosyltransferase [Thermoleophilaceae bacterium]|nr:glycosyltransferase [Thermoleophilaceae bacterium]